MRKLTALFRFTYLCCTGCRPLLLKGALMSKMGSTIPPAIFALVFGALVSSQLLAAEHARTTELRSIVAEMEDTLRGIELDISLIESTGLIDSQSLEIE